MRALVSVVADQQWHISLLAGGVQVVRVIRYDVAINDGQCRVRVRNLRQAVESRGRDHLRRNSSQLAYRIRTERCCKRHAALLGIAQNRHSFGRARGTHVAAALRDGGVEKATRQRRDHELVDRPCTGRLANDRDIPRIATERFDVVSNPTQPRDHIEQAVVTRHFVLRFCRELGMHEKTDRPDTIGKVDRDDLMCACQLVTVVERRRRRAEAKRAAVQVNHDRQLRPFCGD